MYQEIQEYFSYNVIMNKNAIKGFLDMKNEYNIHKPNKSSWKLEGKDYHGMIADVWSSGIVLFGMISGYLLFCDQDDEVNKQSVLNGDRY